MAVMSSNYNPKKCPLIYPSKGVFILYHYNDKTKHGASEGVADNKDSLIIFNRRKYYANKHFMAR
jgi:hypothetical protein